MGRSKLSSGEKDRQPRVDTAASDVQETDPIAAAAHAKKAREETRIKAAAAAAAKAFAGKSKTVFFESTGVSTTTDNTPRPESNSALANSSTRTSSNPLASILGYDNDDSASEDGSEPPSPRAITAAQAATSPDAAESITTNAEPGKDNAEEEDPMLASFMSELESSGLLERDSAQKPAQDTLPHGTDTEQADSRISTSPKPQTASEAQLSLAAAIVDAVNDDTAEVPKQQDLSSLPEQEATSLANADASPSEPAEQRVLGNLEGAPTWREVMDMASGKVYFWEQDTDEVAWEPPPGAKPRSRQANAVTFTAHSSPADPPSSLGTPDMPGAAAAVPAHADVDVEVHGESHSRQMGQADGPYVGNMHERPQASTSEGSSEHIDQHSSEEKEDGQLAEVGSAQASTPAAASSEVVDAPDAQVGVAGQQTCDELRQATRRLCCNVPQLVRLAVEAEVRLQDWHMFSSKQQRAVDESLPQGALCWKDFQDHMQWRWQSIQAALPGAVAEAEQLHQRMDQDLEAGEMPPLPSDEIVPALSVDAVAQAGSITAKQPNTAAGNAVALDLDEPSGSIEAPPLPADTLPPAANASTASPDQPPAAVGHATAAHKAAVAADHDDVDDEDMELDMDVDTDVSPEARVSRAGSAEAAGMSAAEASSSLPNWAGYYMAHGYTYPYYGQAAGASTSQPAAAAAAGSVGPDPAATPTSHAADFLATRLAKDPSPTPQPAIQMPAPVKKKQYRAEPAPAPPVDPDGAAGAADGVLTALPVPTAGPGPDKQAQEAEAKKRKRPKAPVGLGQLAAKKKKGTKGVSGLIDKWQAVRKDLEEQEAKAEEEQFPDPAAQERKRSEEAEKWRLHQLQAGASSEDNANFQPLAVDWREKLKATRKGSKKAPAVSSLEAATPAAPSQATTSPPKPGEAAELGVTADGKPNLGLLSKGLPPGWQAMWDKNTGDIYYGNLKSRARLLQAARCSWPATNSTQPTEVV
ncbi:TPA: hypothetical protein ACH3X2_009548 [Trebouxia sp. C0005]